MAALGDLDCVRLLSRLFLLDSKLTGEINPSRDRPSDRALFSKCCTKASTSPSRSTICLLLPGGGGFSVTSWLTQSVPRRLQKSQTSEAPEKMHFDLRRLHSQHDCVPLRSFRRFEAARASASGCRFWPGVESVVRCCSSNDICSPIVRRNEIEIDGMDVIGKR
jgi:hypothetical protein